MSAQSSSRVTTSLGSNGPCGFILFSLSFDSFDYGQGAGVVAVLRATGAVVGLLKSAELLLVSAQLTVRTTDRALEFVPEIEIGAVSKQLAVLP
jgi:hypothetical protein